MIEERGGRQSRERGRGTEETVKREECGRGRRGKVEEEYKNITRKKCVRTISVQVLNYSFEIHIYFGNKK